MTGSGPGDLAPGDLVVWRRRVLRVVGWTTAPFGERRVLITRDDMDSPLAVLPDELKPAPPFQPGGLVCVE